MIIEGLGISAAHCTIVHTPADGDARALLLTPASGAVRMPRRRLARLARPHHLHPPPHPAPPARAQVCFLNGRELEPHQAAPLAHNDRLILGNSQVFRVADPLSAAAEHGGGAAPPVIDWDFAQQELHEALGDVIQVTLI